jgi:hypothetical protein
MKNKSFITDKWIQIKELYESKTNNNKNYMSNFELDGELDQLIQHFLGYMIKLTTAKGFDAEVEGVKLDLWKERIWNIVENAGLLPEIAWRDEKED